MIFKDRNLWFLSVFLLTLFFCDQNKVDRSSYYWRASSKSGIIWFSPVALIFQTWCYTFTVSGHQNLSSLPSGHGQSLLNSDVTYISSFSLQPRCMLLYWRGDTYEFCHKSWSHLVLFFKLYFCVFFRIAQCLAICSQVKIQSFSSLSIMSSTALATVFLYYISLQAGKVFWRWVSIYFI